MKVKEIAKRYSAASGGQLVIEVTSGNAQGKHSFSHQGVNELIDNDAPILSRTVGMVKVIDNNLVITAY